jgi:hypothetical protein
MLKPSKASHDQILIVTEDTKSSKYYFEEIKSYFKLPTAKVLVLHSAQGTSPDQVVDYAIKLGADIDSRKRLFMSDG